MTENEYAAPALTEIGTLHDMTLQANTKDRTGSDGEFFEGPLGPVS